MCQVSNDELGLEMLTHAIINHKMIPTTMSTFDELGIELRRRLREHDLNQLELSKKECPGVGAPVPVAHSDGQ